MFYSNIFEIAHLSGPDPSLGTVSKNTHGLNISALAFALFWNSISATLYLIASPSPNAFLREQSIMWAVSTSKALWPCVKYYHLIYEEWIFSVSELVWKFSLKVHKPPLNEARNIYNPARRPFLSNCHQDNRSLIVTRGYGTIKLAIWECLPSVLFHYYT